LGSSLLSHVASIIASIPAKAKHLLHIGSPSRVFHDIGENIMLGLSNGIDQNADMATNSIEDMTYAMLKSMNTFPDALSDLTDMNPVVTPVLDLTEVQSGAQQMNSILATNPVVATASYGQATSISTQAAQTTDDTTVAPGATSIKFEQNNYSPESLSPIDIYRQTKNQISQAKQVLAMA
jgi:hypothetical protein